MKKNILLVLLFFFFLHAAAQQTAVDSLELTTIANNPCTPIKDQYLSSTCWSFAGNSLIESELMKAGVPKPDLSEMFIARYSYLHKIKRHLALQGANFFTPGGQFHDIQWVIKKYGMVPEEVYRGKPHGEANHDHTLLDTAVAQFIRKALAKHQRSLTAADEQYLQQLLDKHLGKVPARFIYKGKPYTPQSYAKHNLPDDAAGLIEITSYSHHPFYKSFALEDKYNWMNGQYMNVPVNEFRLIIDHALQHGYTVLWDGDTQEPGFDYNKGIAALQIPVADYQQERQATFEDKSTAIDHVMHIVGMAKDKDGHT